MAEEVIARQPKRAATPYVFSARAGAMITNHSRRIVPLKDALQRAVMGAEDIYPDADHRQKRADQMRKIGAHALRRSYRTGLSEIGIPEALAETMIGHARRDLVARYDKSVRLDMRARAQVRWEEHLAGLVDA